MCVWTYACGGGDDDDENKKLVSYWGNCEFSSVNKWRKKYKML